MGRVTKPTIVIPTRASDFNPGLCLTLRSIETNFPHSKVWLVGHKPPWVSDEVGYIPTLQGGQGWRNHLFNMAEVAHSDAVPENFWYFNDDFFVMKKLTRPPVYFDGTLADRVRRLKGVALGSYTRGAETTLNLLHAAGFENPLNFDLHTPMPMSKTGLDDAVGFVLRSGINFWPHLRSIYAAMTGLEGEPGSDFKVATGETDLPKDATYVSSSPRSIQGLLGRQLRTIFNTPSKFEKNDKTGAL